MNEGQPIGVGSDEFSVKSRGGFKHASVGPYIRELLSVVPLGWEMFIEKEEHDIFARGWRFI